MRIIVKIYRQKSNLLLDEINDLDLHRFIINLCYIGFAFYMIACNGDGEDLTYDYIDTQSTLEVSNTIPEDNAYFPSENSRSITVQFNEEIDGSTVNLDTFKLLDENGNYIEGRVSFNFVTNRALFYANSPLSRDTVYQAIVTPGIKSIDGNSLKGDYSWRFSTSERGWTVMIYADGDNNLEGFLLDDINEMKKGYVNLQGLDVIVLVDRIDGYSRDDIVFEEDFTDTRLYRITNGCVKRIGGGTEFPEITMSSDYEANMGNAETLGKFIRYCKNNYPAHNYALILWNHGNGLRGREAVDGDGLNTRAVCVDDTDDYDSLYTAEITDVLEEFDSVDLLGFDACLMGSVEVAYQYRPSNMDFHADVMVASPPVEWGLGWQYDKIFERINQGGGDNGENDEVMGGSELNYSPLTMTAIEFGGIIVEEQFDSTQPNEEGQALSCYDLSRVDHVKDAVDQLATHIVDCNEKEDFEDIRGSYPSPETMHYFYASIGEWISYPFFDIYDLCDRVNVSSRFNDNPIIQTDASIVMQAVDDMVIYSFAGSDYKGFSKGKNGLHIFFTDGDSLTYGNPSERIWAYQWWYNAIDTDNWWNGGHYYGKLDWCQEGAIQGNGKVENWFEMLDYWFDEDIGLDGGWNGYIW
ncbi:MAG: clostripain [Spirochaetota bacterium]|nr:clostripain [Spirochaetota bacterium]